MPFFARPNLDNTQFKQLTGSTLTLSGTTRIATIGGLEFIDELGTCIPVVITGATNQDVLTYINGEIVLSTPTSGASTGVYTCSSPTTCAVGGLAAGFPILNCGIDKILEMILVPIVSPAVTPNSISMTLTPTDTLFEKGSSVSFTTSISYSQGSVSPVYCGGPAVRTGTATGYTFTNIDGSTYTGVISSCAMPAKLISVGNNTIYAAAAYSAGQCVRNSNGTCPTGATYACCPASTISTSNVVTGLYPYFWGLCTCPGPSGANRPSGTSAMVLSGTKVVGNCGSDITINFNATSGNDYLWFALPSNVTNKTCWCCNSSLYGAVGGGISPACNLFPAPIETVNVASITPAWTCSYDIYISNKQSAAATLKMGYA